MPQTTKLALEESLKRLLQTKPLNKVTIRDLTDDCGINRMTFYYHFKDIYDLVEWSCREDARRALAGNHTYDTWQQGLLQICHYVLDNKVFIQNIYRCLGREQVERYLMPLVHALLVHVLDELSAPDELKEEDRDFIARVYAYSFIGLVLDWIRDGMQEEPKSMVSRFARVIQDSFMGAVSRFKKEGPSGL